jgi:hypothetical protein
MLRHATTPSVAPRPTGGRWGVAPGLHGRQSHPCAATPSSGFNAIAAQILSAQAWKPAPAVDEGRAAAEVDLDKARAPCMLHGEASCTAPRRAAAPRVVTCGRRGHPTTRLPRPPTHASAHTPQHADYAALPAATHCHAQYDVSAAIRARARDFTLVETPKQLSAMLEVLQYAGARAPSLYTRGHPPHPPAHNTHRACAADTPDTLLPVPYGQSSSSQFHQTRSARTHADVLAIDCEGVHLGAPTGNLTLMQLSARRDSHSGTSSSSSSGGSSSSRSSVTSSGSSDGASGSGSGVKRAGAAADERPAAPKSPQRPTAKGKGGGGSGGGGAPLDIFIVDVVVLGWRAFHQRCTPSDPDSPNLKVRCRPTAHMHA